MTDLLLLQNQDPDRASAYKKRKRREATPTRYTPWQLAEARKLRDGKLLWREIAAKLGVTEDGIRKALSRCAS